MAKKKKTPIKKAAPAPALAITKKGTAKLSPNQAAFNKLTTRIEKLRNDVTRKESQLEEAMTLYGQTVPLLEEDLFKKKQQLLMLMWPFYKGKKLPRTARPYLKDMLQQLMSDILQNSAGEPDQELKAVFKDLEGEDYDTILKKEEKEMQDAMRKEFKTWGVDVNWAEDEHLSEAEMAAKMHEFEQQLSQKKAAEARHRAEQFKTRPKTEKQMQKEKAEQAAAQLKQKNINVIYRQLAKLFHPDLEQDAERRLEKEALMKSLTAAYENNNLHALLMLELRWIHNENNHLDSLTEEKLAVYLDILRTQAKELEQEKWRMLHQPRFYALVARYGFRPLTYPVKAVRQDIEDIQDEKAWVEKEIAALQGGGAVAYLQAIVKQWKADWQQKQERAHALENWLDILFSGEDE